MFRKIVLLLLLAACVGVASNAQSSCTTGASPRCYDNQSTTVSGTPLKVISNGGLVPSFEYKITGSPATISVVIQGCGTLGTCTTLGSAYTTVANTIITPTVTTAYSYYTVTPTWTGGTGVTFQVSTNITTAVVPTSAGSGFTAGGDLSGTTTSQTVVGIRGAALPALATGYPYYNGSAWVFQTPSGVSSFSAGSLAPLFTTAVATATTTPALSFTLSNAGQNTVLAGPSSGGAGAPSYQLAPTFSAANLTNFPTLNQSTTGTAANVTATSNSTLTTLSALSLPASQVSGLSGTYAPIASPTFTGTVTIPSGAALGTPTSVNLANATFPTLNQSTTGTAANVTATSNSTLTTLSALSLPSTQVTGLGTASIQNTGTSGGNVPLLNGVNTWSSVQTFSAAPINSTITGFVYGNGSSAEAVATQTNLAALANITLGQVLVSAGNASPLVGSTGLTYTSPTLSVGVPGSTTGAITMASSTATGSVKITPASAASAFTATIPAATDTIVELTQTQTLTNKSIALSEVNSGLTAGGVIGATSTTAPCVSTYTANALVKMASSSSTCPGAASVLDNATDVVTTEPLYSANGNQLNGTSATSITSTTLATTGVAFPATYATTARTYRGECLVAWEQATAVATVQFGINTSAAPTHMSLNSVSYVGTTAVPYGTAATDITTAATTAATASLTPSSATTLYVTHIWVTLSAAAAANTVTLYGLTSNASDALLIEPGTYCTWLP